MGEGQEGRAVPEPGNELEVIADATGVSTDRGEQYVVAKWEGVEVPEGGGRDERGRPGGGER